MLCYQLVTSLIFALCYSGKAANPFFTFNYCIMSNPYLALQKALFDKLRDEASNSLDPTGALHLVSVNSGSLGNFPWFYEQQGDFNNSTFTYLNHRMGPDTNGSGALASLGDFLNAYVNTLRAIDFKFSSTDQAKVVSAKNASANDANTLVSNYQAKYGAITAQDLTASGLFKPTRVDYIVQYVAGTLWSGKEAGLSYQEMLNAQSLSALLPKMPASAASIVGDISTYLTGMGSVVNLLDLAASQRGILRDLIQNTLHPTAQNGGIQTISGAGQGHIVPAWTIKESEQKLSHDLGLSNNKITVDISASTSTSNVTKVTVGSSVGFTVPIDFVEIGVSASASYNLEKLSGSGASYKMKAIFPGPTLTHFEPVGYDVSTRSGWYDADPIQGAAKNGKQDITGYYFSSPPPFTIGKGGDLGILNALAMSQFPTIEIDFHQADYSSYKSVVKESASVDVKLFGICKVGGASQSLYKATSKANSSISGFTVTLDPGPNSQLDPSGNSLANQAFVLAAQAVYPGA